MKRITPVVAVAVLLIAGVAQAQTADLAVAPDIFPNWHDAVKASGLDMSQPIHLIPVEVDGRVTEYRLESTSNGEIAFARVRLPVDPTRIVEPETLASEAGRVDSAERATSPYTKYNVNDSSRCTTILYRGAYFVTPLIRVSVDLNSFGDVFFDGTATEINDEVSSIANGCNPIYLFTNASYGGSGTYVPAGTSLSTVTFNDAYSSMFQVIP